MKKVFLAAMLLTPALAWAAPNPTEYALTVHVQASRLVKECDTVLASSKIACASKLHLDVVVEGKRYELNGGLDENLLRTGDYKARLLRDTPPNSYEYRQEYEFLFPDGTKRKFAVIGEMQ